MVRQHDSCQVTLTFWPRPTTRFSHPTWNPHSQNLCQIVPLSTCTQTDQNSSNAGRFSLNAVGVTEGVLEFVGNLESEIVSWFRDRTVFLSPDEKDLDDLGFPGEPAGQGAIHKAARTPSRIVWVISEIGFARCVVPRHWQFRRAFSSYHGHRIHANDSQAKPRLDNVSPIPCGQRQVTKPRFWMHLLPQMSVPLLREI